MTSNKPSTKEPHFEFLYEMREKHGLSELGIMANSAWNNDPRKLLISRP